MNPKENNHDSRTSMLSSMMSSMLSDVSSFEEKLQKQRATEAAGQTGWRLERTAMEKAVRVAKRETTEEKQKNGILQQNLDLANEKLDSALEERDIANEELDRVQEQIKDLQAQLAEKEQAEDTIQQVVEALRAENSRLMDIVNDKSHYQLAQAQVLILTTELKDKQQVEQECEAYRAENARLLDNEKVFQNGHKTLQTEIVKAMQLTNLQLEAQHDQMGGVIERMDNQEQKAIEMFAMADDIQTTVNSTEKKITEVHHKMTNLPMTKEKGKSLKIMGKEVCEVRSQKSIASSSRNGGDPAAASRHLVQSPLTPN